MIVAQPSLLIGITDPNLLGNRSVFYTAARTMLDRLDIFVLASGFLPHTGLRERCSTCQNGSAMLYLR